MAEAAQARVQKAVNGLVNEIDHTHLRKLQGDMHRCAANCCDSSDYTLEQVHRCIEDCSKDVTSAQNCIQQELSNFQDRLQRCVLQCQDNVREKILPNTTEEEVAKYKMRYEECIVKCADTHAELVPNLVNRMKQILSSKKY